MKKLDFSDKILGSISYLLNFQTNTKYNDFMGIKPTNSNQDLAYGTPFLTVTVHIKAILSQL